MQTHLETEFFVKKTRTTIRACYDNIQNYTYLGINYNRTTADDKTTVTGYTADMKQSSANISLLTLAIEQNFRLGILNWENRLTYQKSSQEVLLAVPALNYWTNLYLNFTIARVLRVHFGADMRWFSKYYAPEYCPQAGRYGIQENDALRAEVGNYPIVNVYANFRLKQCRFFVMMSHVNAGSGNRNYFLSPHHPQNERIFRLGLSWTFFN
jgi:outer membrane receptor for ferrienterochelin and colicin